MPSFDSDGVEIAYERMGQGSPVLLIHGFASNWQVNWIDTGWPKALNDAGYEAIVIDNRGHGQSEKLYEPDFYTAAIMAEDCRRLLDHLGIAKADIIGYSMGARISALLAIAHPGRVRRLVLGGLAASMIHGVAGAEEIALGLEAPSMDQVTQSGPRAFRKFAEQTKSDLHALAACMRASRQKISVDELGRIAAPTLVIAGEMDDIAGPVEPLVAAIPGARGVTVPRRNHMNMVGDRAFKSVAIAFLSG